MSQFAYAVIILMMELMEQVCSGLMKFLNLLTKSQNRQILTLTTLVHYLSEGRHLIVATHQSNPFKTLFDVFSIHI